MTMWMDLAGVPFRQTFHDARGIRTRVIEAGSGEPLIFLHGTGGHAEAFSRNIAAHAQHHHVISVDMIGHGYTDAPDIDYTMQTLLDHVRDLMDAMGLQKAAIAGVSLGGLIGAWFAIQHPARVSKLTLITAMLMPRDTTGKAELTDANNRTRAAATTLTREAVRARLAWLMHKPEHSITDELVDVRHAIYSQPGRGPIIARISNIIIGGLIDEAWTHAWSHPRHLAGIRCPTLVVWTAHNPGMNVARAREGMGHIADARMVVFENSGHWPQWEEAERFNRENIAFLNGPSV